ncbi:MAG: hypothetical protein ACXV7G_10290 [Halobacteriota archaeon]
MRRLYFVAGACTRSWAAAGCRALLRDVKDLFDPVDILKYPEQGAELVYKGVTNPRHNHLYSKSVYSLMFLENAVSVAVLKRCKRQEGMRMKGDEKIRANAVQPIFGEVISVPQLAKGMDLKEGEDLEYTTPMGLHIKAHIEKGAPVNVEFFHDGESIKPELTVKAIDLSGIPDIEWECRYVWEPYTYHVGETQLTLYRLVQICWPKRR